MEKEPVGAHFFLKGDRLTLLKTPGLVAAFTGVLLVFQGRLSAFTFLTPIFGVLAGVIFLNEEFTGSLMMGLPTVCVGIFLVNWKRKNVGIEPLK